MAKKSKKPRAHIPDLQPMQDPVPARPLPSPKPAARAIFRASGIAFEEGADGNDPWKVVGRFLFWPMNGYWRSEDDKDVGYTALNLVRLVRRQAASPEGVAAVAAALDPTAAPAAEVPA